MVSRHLSFLCGAAALLSAFLLVRQGAADFGQSLPTLALVTLLAGTGLGLIVRHFGWVRALLTAVLLAVLVIWI